MRVGGCGMGFDYAYSRDYIHEHTYTPTSMYTANFSGIVYIYISHIFVHVCVHVCTCTYACNMPTIIRIYLLCVQLYRHLAVAERRLPELQGPHLRLPLQYLLRVGGRGRSR